MDKLKYKLTSPVVMWIIVIVGGLILWRVVPEGRIFYSGWLGIAALVLGLANWLFVSLTALRVHRLAPKSANAINRLVTEGMYAVVRHPLYAADIMLAWCVFIFLPSYQILAIAAWLTLVLFFWAGLEERMLEEKFLKEYREYKKQVPMFVPRWRKRNQ